MYYTHEYSNEEFDTLEACEIDLEETVDIDEYVWRIDITELMRKYFHRKSNDDFCIWFDDKICEIDDEIKNDLIFEHEEEESEE